MEWNLVMMMRKSLNNYQLQKQQLLVLPNRSLNLNLKVDNCSHNQFPMFKLKQLRVHLNLLYLSKYKLNNLLVSKGLYNNNNPCKLFILNQTKQCKDFNLTPINNNNSIILDTLLPHKTILIPCKDIFLLNTTTKSKKNPKMRKNKKKS